MTSAAGVVIVGAGQAGGDLAVFLRQQGYEGRITLVGSENHVPYRRPPLSKAFLSGDIDVEGLHLRSPAAYAKSAIELRLRVTVTAIDRAGHELLLSDGSRLPYDKLALTLGGRARTLPLPGADLPNVHYVRTIDDIERLKARFKPQARLVIIGGGYIGLEAASVGIKKGLKVTVLEALPRVLARVTAPEISAFYERVHRSRGVDLRTGAGVRGLVGTSQVDAVVLNDGTHIETDLVIVGIGLIPNTELACAAGLEAGSDGIFVDQYAQTSDPDIVAAGDCTYHQNAFLGRRLRLESVPNATEQARVAAATLLGKQQPHSAAPWFWSDQYDLKLQMAGLSQGFDQLVVRGDIGGESFIAFYLQAGVVIAADAVNRPQDFVLARKLVTDRVLAQASALKDESCPLKTLL